MRCSQRKKVAKKESSNSNSIDNKIVNANLKVGVLPRLCAVVAPTNKTGYTIVVGEANALG
jgi:hypothetical protein